MTDFPTLNVTGPRVRVDARAHHRDRYHPETVTIVRVDGPLNALINKAISAQPIPAAVVASDGSALILTCGGSGVIWTQGEPSPEQAEVVQAISDALGALGAKKTDEPKAPTGKTSRKKKAEAPEEQATEEAEPTEQAEPTDPTEEVPVVEAHPDLEWPDE